MKLLVTTAIEKTWGQSEDVVFLGEWCKLYDRRSKWSVRNHETLHYNWDDRQKLYTDYPYLEQLYEKILPELSIKLNKVHEVDYSANYWRIAIGVWLGYFIQIAYQRWISISNATSSSAHLESIILDQEPASVLPHDMLEFVGFFTDDKWNHYIFGSIIRFQNKISYRTINLQKDSDSKSGQPIYKKSLKEKIKYGLLASLREFNSLVLSRFSRKADFFFIATYLSVFDELRLNMRFGQVPLLPSAGAIPITPYDDQKRNWVLEYTGDDAFERFVKFMIPQQIPIVYLEGYKKLNAYLQTFAWPRKPKLIFTANSHIYDDFTKLWMADKVEAGAALVIGQHGGGPLHALNFQTDHELVICNKYLFPGINVDDWHKKIVGVGQFFSRKWHNKPTGRGLLIQLSVPRYSYAVSSTVQSDDFIFYLADQQRFITALPESIRNEFTIRLASTDFDWSARSRWENAFPEVDIDNGQQPIYELFKQSKIIVCTYPGTTYNQTLAANAPTVIFWDEKYSEMHHQSVAYFDGLKKVGIFHTNPESAAHHIEKVWDDVYGWWMSEEVQSARKSFCNKYAYIPKDLVGNIEKSLRDVLEHEM